MIFFEKSVQIFLQTWGIPQVYRKLSLVLMQNQSAELDIYRWEPYFFIKYIDVWSFLSLYSGQKAQAQDCPF